MMSSLYEILMNIGGFFGGMIIRLAVVALAMLVLASPGLLAVGALRLYRALHPVVSGLRRAGHVLYKPGARYAAGHTWLEREGERVKVGLDGVGQELLPWALSVQLPRPGQELKEGEVAAVISCGGIEARVAAPVAGRVVAVNAEVERDPSLVKDDGYGKGWLFALAPADARWSTLPAGETAREWLAGESDRLDRFLEERLGFAGFVSRAGPAPRTLAGADWQDLTAAFLHA